MSFIDYYAIAVTLIVLIQNARRLAESIVAVVGWAKSLKK